MTPLDPQTLPTWTAPSDPTPPPRLRPDADAALAQPADEYEPSDHELLRQFREGNQEAATRIFLRYAHRLHALARARCCERLAQRVEADDIVQSVFRTFFRRVSRGCYDVPDGEELWKLFLVIALNKIRDERSYHFAAKRDVRLAKGSGFLERLATAPGQDPRPRLHLKMVISEALATLPAAYRRIVEMRIDGHEVAEIARATERSKRTVERTLQEFRTKLSKLLSVEEHA